MAGFLSKFISGATGQASTLYADQAQQQLRDQLLAKRDAVLQANREAQMAKEREFQMTDKTESRQYEEKQTAEQRAYTSKENELDRKSRESIAASKTTDKEINDGTAKAFQTQKLAVFKQKVAENEEKFGDEKLSVKEMWDEADEIVSQSMGRPSPRGGDTGGGDTGMPVNDYIQQDAKGNNVVSVKGAKRTVSSKDKLLTRDSDGAMFILINGKGDPVPLDSSVKKEAEKTNKQEAKKPAALPEVKPSAGYLGTSKPAYKYGG